MATLLYRLGKTAYRHWPRFIAGWVVLLIAVGVLAAAFAKPTSDAFTIPGIPSEKAQTLQSELFPSATDAFDQADVNVVVVAPEGERIDELPYSSAVDALVADLQGLPQLDPDPSVNPQLGNPAEIAAAQEQTLVQQARQSGGDVDAARANAAAVSPLSQDPAGRAGIISFALDVDTPADVKASTIDALTDAMDQARDAGLTVEANGTGSQTQIAPGGAAELIGVGIALVVLLLTFGSLVAAGLPIVIALIGVAIGSLGITAATALVDVSSFTPILAVMIGLAVGIDYTLFILSRYRSELEHGDDRADAVGRAVGTAGSAVVFAGLTVLIALAALSVVRIPFLTAMGLAAAATVFIAVLIALTLLPAVLGMLKSKSFGGRLRTYAPRRDDDGRIVNNGVRWARLLGRKPIAAVLLVIVALGALAIPIKDLQLAFPTDSTASSDTTQRQAADLTSEFFGPGRSGPLLAVVDARDVDDADRGAAFGTVAQWAAGQDDVANAQIVATNADPSDPQAVGTGALVQITPSSGPDDPATQDLLTALRDGQGDIEQQTGTTIGVTGLTAITTDVSDRLSDALPIYLVIVVGLAFILLMIVFRSLLVPLTATLGFLLSVLATLGATVAVFQQGAFGLFEGQPIVSFVPIFLIGVVFGLAMDYQVFLVTRIREAHVHGMSTKEAVVDGFRNSARVVTAAATIMTAVFAGFMLEDDPIIKSMGFALAIAIVFDAFIVRMVLVPGLLYLMGDKAWYLPAWLDKVLPDVDVEGEKLQRPGRSAELPVTHEVEQSDHRGEHVREPIG